MVYVNRLIQCMYTTAEIGFAHRAVRVASVLIFAYFAMHGIFVVAFWAVEACFELRRSQFTNSSAFALSLSHVLRRAPIFASFWLSSGGGNGKATRWAWLVAINERRSAFGILKGAIMLSYLLMVIV